MPDGDSRIGLDLVAPEVYAPMLRRLALVSAAVGVGVAVLAAMMASWPVAVAFGLVVGAPTAGYAMAARRRRMWLSGTVIHAQRLFGARRIELAAANGVELLVYPGRLSRVALRVTAGPDAQIVPLAMYTDAGSGRELHLLGLRKLADALAASELAAAVAVSSVLVRQLRAEARDAALGERPLYLAVRLARAKELISPFVLSDREVAELS
ncbi:hypothetical protein ACFVMC_19710 [Nocardia sp. NPDC127579]|uniref:hypothetical protein n=1 Tax=Nocardia sp. NPDC127579 TaxID=3345402 RepID=UPI003643D20A